MDFYKKYDPFWLLGRPGWLAGRRVQTTCLAGRAKRAKDLRHKPYRWPGRTGPLAVDPFDIPNPLPAKSHHHLKRHCYYCSCHQYQPTALLVPSVTAHITNCSIFFAYIAAGVFAFVFFFFLLYFSTTSSIIFCHFFTIFYGFKQRERRCVFQRWKQPTLHTLLRQPHGCFCFSFSY